MKLRTILSVVIMSSAMLFNNTTYGAVNCTEAGLGATYNFEMEFRDSDGNVIDTTAFIISDSATAWVKVYRADGTNLPPDIEAGSLDTSSEGEHTHRFDYGGYISQFDPLENWESGDGDACIVESDYTVKGATLKATASGERKAESGETLVFANDGKSRSVELTVECDATLRSGYPKWSGVNGTDGNMSVSASVNADATAKADLSDNLCKEITVDFQPNLKGNVSQSFDEGAGKIIADKINDILKLVDSDCVFQDSGGEVKLEYEKVDKYEDGQSLGWKIKGEGSVSASLTSSIDWEFPRSPAPPIPIPLVSGLSIRFNGSFSDITATFSGSGELDESKASHGSCSVGASAGLGVSVGTDLSITGFEYLVISVTGSSSYKANVELKKSDEGLKLEGTSTFSAFKAEASLNVKVGSSKWQICGAEKDFDAGFTDTISIPL